MDRPPSPQRADTGPGRANRLSSIFGRRVQRPSLRNPHDVGLAPSKIPRALQWAAVAVFVAMAVASGVFSFTDHWRRATFTLGAAMLWLSLVRATCDSQVLGIFAVRSRRFDVTFTTLIGLSLLYVSATVASLGS